MSQHTNHDSPDHGARIRLPVGMDNFGKLLEKELSFVDKSLFIKEVLDDTQAEVSVITRPRRFGKTLNLSMLHYFLAPEVEGQVTKGMFDHLKIAQYGAKYLAHQGKYPVISITLKEIKESSFELALLRLSKLMSDIYNKYYFLLDSEKLNDHEKTTFRLVLSRQSDNAVLQDSLKDLMRYLYVHYGSKPWLLIDEYDSPIHAAYAHGYYEEMIHFMKGFFGAALKNNEYLERAVVTGILRISKESLFSGVNNLYVYSILDKKYSEHFGFTESEMEALLKKGNLLDKFSEIREWYNGYQFGNTTIYNPWSIANYLHTDYQLRPYWVNTSDNQLIKDLLKKSSLDFKKDFEILMNGGVIEKVIDSHVVFKYLGNHPTGVWNLLLMSGYLKPVSSEVTRQGDLCELKIPNKEVFSLYQQIIEQWLSNGNGIEWYNQFIDNLVTGKIDQFKVDLEKIVYQIMSYHDLAKEPEAFYHGLLLGFTVSLHDIYEIKSNRESGLGRFDIMLIPKDINKMGIIIELKIKADNEILETTAKRALTQIEDKKYDQEFQQRKISKIVKIGIGFEGKEFALEYVVTDKQ